MIDKEIKYQLESIIDHDEELIWTGSPKQGIKFQVLDLYMIPFSILWCGFAIFWMMAALEGSAFFALFGVPFVLMGLFMVFGRFIFDAIRRKKTFYGITEKRLIIKSGVFSVDYESIMLNKMPTIKIIEKGDRSGTLIIGKDKNFVSMFRGTGWPLVNKDLAPSLEMIPDVRRVYELLRNVDKG